MMLRSCFVVLLCFAHVLFAQSLKDTIRNEKKILPDEQKSTSKENKPFSVFNPSFKKESESFMLPLNLKIYAKVFSNDYKESPKFLTDELSSGLSDNELLAFRKNRDQMQKELEDFYGEDLIDMKKILDALGITKEQVVMIAAVLKFIFAQSVLPAPR